MASASACWRCTGRALLQSSTRSRSSSASRLPRTSIAAIDLTTRSRSLHTTPPLPAAAKGGGANQRKPTVNKPLNLKTRKKTVQSNVKKPEVGYRRALRKAIILSNANAPNLDLPELTAELTSDTESIGKVFSINIEDLEKLRTLEAFQKRQQWQFFYRPTTFIRNESVGLARAMESVERFGVDGASATSEGEGAAMKQENFSEFDEANKVIVEPETAEAELAAMEQQEEGIIAKLDLQLKTIKDDIAIAELQIEELLANPEGKANTKAINKINNHKETLERQARSIVPMLNYHENLEARKIHRAEHRKPHQPQSLEEYEALLDKKAKEAGDRKLQKEEMIAAKKEAQDKTSRQSANFVLTGKAGTGKSILLLQAMVAAIKRKWIVMTIPNVHDVVIGTTSYEINADTGRYVQRDYLWKMLGRIGKANADVLLATKVEETLQIGTTEIPAGSPLMKIVDAGSTGPEHSYEAFTAFLAQLEKPGAPPVLFTLDNLDYAMRMESGYKTPEFKDVYPPNLDILHTFFEYLSGRRQFARQMIIAATTTELHPNPSLDLTLAGKPLPGIGKFDHQIPPIIGTLARTINVKGLNREHTKRLLEFYKLAGLWDYSWDRSVPITPALEKAGITEDEYRNLRISVSNPDAPEALEQIAEEGESEVEESNGSQQVPARTTVTEIEETLALSAAEKERENSKEAELRRLLQALKEKPLTDHEVAERYVLTGGVPRLVMQHCLRLQGSLIM